MKIYPTGSYFICSPPVLNTDIDFVIFTEDFDNFCEDLLKNGWSNCSGKEYPYVDFIAFKRREISGVVINYIVTSKEEYYNKYVIATDTARALNLTKKVDRIALFQEVLK